MINVQVVAVRLNSASSTLVGFKRDSWLNEPCPMIVEWSKAGTNVEN
jgi:hypothetical protein